MSISIHPKYRPDIDGLRAVAILMVVLFHGFPAILPGGFIGVNIFFVISGYLISTIIFSNLQQGSFSFADFYARRIKRIFPAFLLVVFSSLVFGWLFLFPREWKELAKHAFNSVLFISNFALIERTGYFDASVEKNPLLHLWSLCVEEQYYLLWPLMASFVFKRNGKILSLIVAVFGLSFLTNIFLVYLSPVADFYLPMTRFWELLTGSFLAWITLRHGGIGNYLANRFDYSSLIFHHAFSICGIVLITACAVFISNTSLFPGFYALLPVMGSMLLIDAGQESVINRYLLGNRLMVAIGLISYPLYLWHWPLLSFAKIISPEPLSSLLITKLLIAAFILAVFTYWFLEKPLRKLQRTNKTKLLLIGAALILIIAALGHSQLFPPRSALNGRGKILSAANDWEYPGDFNFNKKDNFHLLMSNKNGKGSVLVIGDSHAEQYWSRLQQQVSKNPEHSPFLLFATYGSCPPLPGFENVKDALYCDEFYHFSFDFAKNSRVNNIVFSAYWEAGFNLAYDDRDQNAFTAEKRQLLQSSMEQFIKDINLLHKQGKKVFIILSNPTAKNYNPAKMVGRFDNQLRQTPLSKQAWLLSNAPVRTALQHVAAKTGAILIDPVDTLCRDDLCQVADQDHYPFYKDGDHLNRSTVLKKGSFIDPVLLP